MLETIILFLISVFIFIYQPFVGALLIPTPVRIGIMVLLLAFFITLSIRKRSILIFLVAMVPLTLLFAGNWYLNSPASLPDIAYVIAFIILAVCLLKCMERMPQLGFALSRYMLVLVLLISVWAIMCFAAFNLSLVPFRPVNLGGFAYYDYYYNPLLGYIDPRQYESGIVGRVAGFMFEPSFMGWFLTTNFFLLDNYFRKRGASFIIAKFVVFGGVASTVSIGALAVLILISGLNLGFILMKKMGFRARVINIVTWIFIIGLPLAYLLVPKDDIGDKMGKSSLGDREGRMQSTLLILATSGIKDIVLGHSPGYIEKMGFEKGESNQYMKLTAEEGAVLLFLVFGFIVYCSRTNRNYLLSNLIFLNSVVIIWTPLFVVNLVVCKWMEIRRRQLEQNIIEEDIV
ncbi:hypothetical protein GA0116948_11256 [Chitinophaga costaii]|uniref:O-Antigen ligase n=1 Tax=Chitinophaga costaii TaxID=1335309 RepID=A0A1C4F7H9_9BACT|nr:hypothetical protein [Chitinophaga costaii]PUZ21233.1 hypothetical protein DCM91_16970 [Chitinophaga costaii]SCC51655.1 hypothetical protein GA0116948_11256 [Chitinophaga costaii]